MRPIISAAATLLLVGSTYAAPAAEAAVGLDLEARAGRFKYYNMPTKEAGPCDLTTGPDGAIWGQDFLINKLFRIDPKTETITEYDIPYTLPVLNISAPARTGITACAIQPGKDGNIYAATGFRNQFLKLDLQTKKITVSDTSDPQNPTGNLQPFNDLWAGDKGMFFTQTTANKICQFDYQTEKITCFSPPTPMSSPLGLFVASDNLLYFTEFVANKIGTFNQSSHEFKEYPISTPGQSPTVMRAETTTDGRNLVWFTNIVGQTIGSIDIVSKAIKLYPVAVPASLPTEDTVDSYGRVWYSTTLSATLNVLNASTGKSRAIPEAGIALNPPGLPPPVNIAIHYGPGNKIWFTDLALNKVGTYQLLGCGTGNGGLTPCTA